MISEEFYEAFHSGIASHCVTCGCGITYFSLGGCWSDSEADYDKMLELSESNPDKYAKMDPNEAASLIDLGVDFVDGCPCGTSERYENWIWKNRERIIGYIRARSQKEVANAQTNLDNLSKLANI